MERVKEIIRPSFRLVRDGEHYDYHSRILATVTPMMAKEYKMEELRLVYEKYFKREEYAYMRNRAFEETKEIQAADQKRDELFCFIKRTIEIMRYNPDSTIRASWEELDGGLEPYRNAHRKSFLENTTMISLFIEEMEKEKYTHALQNLDLFRVFDLLKDANEKCYQLYNERQSKKEKRSKEDKMRNIRPQVDLAYFEFIKFINAIYLVSYQITKEQQVITEMGKVIDQINAYTKQMQDNILQRRAEEKSSKNTFTGK